MNRMQAGLGNFFVLLSLSAAVVPLQCVAQAWPQKQVRIVIPFEAGGGTDIQGRLLAKKLHDNTGFVSVVENRPGASGLIGAEAVVRSLADGHSLLFTSGSLAVNVSLYKKLAFDPVKDLAAVSKISSSSMVLLVHPSVPVTSIKELVTYAKANPRKLNVGSAGIGTGTHLAIELFKLMAGVDMTHVPYKGSSRALTSILSGETNLFFATFVSGRPLADSGKVRPIGVTAARKAAAFPDVPTIDSVIPGYESESWYGMFAPAATPRDTIGRIHAEMFKALNSPELRDFMVKEGGEAAGSTPDETTAYFRLEVERYARVVKSANLQVE